MGTTPANMGVATAPSECELSYELDVDGVKSPLGEYCVVGERTVAGGCAPPLHHARLGALGSAIAEGARAGRVSVSPPSRPDLRLPHAPG